MTDSERLITIIEEGRVKEVCGCIQDMLDAGYDQQQIVQECVMPALETVGNRFERQQVFIPQMLMAARTVNAGNEYMRKKLPQQSATSRHKVVIGTVKDDLHFLGKNLVATSMRSVGIEVVDLGVDVSAEQFVAAAEFDPDVAIVAISTLLNPTMPAMKKTVKALKASTAANRIKIMVGGCPVTEQFAKSIGADFYTETAYSAAVVAKRVLEALD